MSTANGQEYLSELKTKALEAQLKGSLKDAEALWIMLFRSTHHTRGEHDAELPKILLQAADTAMQRRDYAGSCEYAERALRLLDEIGDTQNGRIDRKTKLRALNLQASAYRLLGRWSDAELTLQIVLMEAEFSLGEGHPEVAAAWSELALVYVELNQPAEAERVRVRAMEASSRAQATTGSWPTYCAFTPGN